MGPVIARHYAILEEVLARFGGRVIKKTGDGVFALFPDEAGELPSAALECALELQRRFQDEDWPLIGELRVRMGFHCGQAEEVAGDYYGPTANRTAPSCRWAGAGRSWCRRTCAARPSCPRTPSGRTWACTR